ncbi:MAG TPA: methylamine utilization protein [Gammaproteobacteria bacterium]
MTDAESHRNAKAVFAALAALAALAGSPASAAGLQVRVTADDGAPVPDAAVYALRLDDESSGGPSVSRGIGAAKHTHPPIAVMDQRHRAFVPHVLVVQAGTLIDFPNNDSVSHHVYSFSPARPFELSLYRGSEHPPLPFDTPGLVVVGCNIHDDMLGYILVVDTPHFGKTNPHGIAALEGLPAGRYSVNVWTPRLRPEELPHAQIVTLGPNAREAVDFELDARLLPPHDDGESSLTWNDY